MVEVKAGLLRNVDSQRLAALVSQRTRRNMIIHPTQTGTHVVFCDSVAKLRRTLQSHTISAIVCDLRDGIDDGLMATLQWASSLDTSPTLSVFLSLRQREVRHLLTLLADGLRVRALVWEHQQIGDDADYIAPGVDTIGAASRVLPRIIDVIPPGAEEIVVGAILLGGRRRSVGSLA